MLEYFEIDGVRFHDTGKRALSRVEGLVGIAGVRDNVVARTERHGSFDRTRWQTDRLVTLEGECWGDSIADAYAEFDQLAEALYRTLEAPRLAKWRRPDARIGFTNLIPRPSFEGGVSPWTSVFSGGLFGATGATLESEPVADAPDGEAVAKCMTGAVVSQGMNVELALTAGVTYAVRLKIKREAGGSFLRISAGNLSSPFNDHPIATTANPSDTEYTEYTALITPTATSTYRFYIRTGAATATTFRVDACMMVVSPALVGYFDGDTRGGRWLGAEQASASIFEGIALQALVKLAGEIVPPLEEGAKMLRYQAQVRQADPRAYMQTARSAVGAALAAAAGGLEFPFEFPILFNESSGGEATVTNNGPVETPLILRLYGFLSAPRVQLLPSGPEIKLTGDVPAGSYLEIDTAGPSIRMNGTLDRMDMLDGVNSTFFDLPTGTHQVRLFAFNSDPAAHLEVETRDAYNG